MSIKELFKVTGIPVFLASLCCLAPIVLVVLGLSTVSFAASLTNILDGKYQWVFDLVGLIGLSISLVLYFRNRGICTIDQAKKHRDEIINKTLLALIAGLVLYYIFFYVILSSLGQHLRIWQ